MLTDIEQLKNDFLIYLNFLVFSPQEAFFKKIQPLQETKLMGIEFQSHSERKLSIISKSEDENISVITFNHEELETYGLSITDFKNSLIAIKNSNRNSEKLFLQAIEEVFYSHNEKIYKLYITSAILTYTKLYEKFRLANPTTDKNGIYHLLDETIENSLIDKPRKLIYNYFKRAYQEYKHSTCFASIFGDETENLKIIFNITKELKLNFIYYQKAYINLINSIKKLNLYAKDKEAAKILIEQLEHHTNNSFSSLIQNSLGEQNEKTIIENFKLTTKKLISNYIKDHPNECEKQRNILKQLLWFITKIIPESILSKEKRQSLFGKYTNAGREIKNLTNQVIEKSINLVY